MGEPVNRSSRNLTAIVAVCLIGPFTGVAGAQPASAGVERLHVPTWNATFSHSVTRTSEATSSDNSTGCLTTTTISQQLTYTVSGKATARLTNELSIGWNWTGPVQGEIHHHAEMHIRETSRAASSGSCPNAGTSLSDNVLDGRGPLRGNLLLGIIPTTGKEEPPSYSFDINPDGDIQYTFDAHATAPNDSPLSRHQAYAAAPGAAPDDMMGVDIIGLPSEYVMPQGKRRLPATGTSLSDTSEHKDDVYGVVVQSSWSFTPGR